MLQKIENYLKNGKYLPCSQGAGAYLNQKDGWVDYYLTDHLLFSHRANQYDSPELPERLHSHDYYEVIFIAKGERSEYIADGRSLWAERGMVILTKPMKIHMYRLEKPAFYERFVVYFKDPQTLFPFEGMMDFAKKGDDFFAAFSLPDSYFEKLKEASAALLENRPYAKEKAYLILGEVFLGLCGGEALNMKEAAPSFIREIKDYIDLHYASIPSVSALCERFYYSREYISRSFHRYYNTPLYDYILQRKLLFCRILLQEGESVANAARRAGFHNMASFAKLFKKHFGCAPSEYKNRPVG